MSLRRYRQVHGVLQTLDRSAGKGFLTLPPPRIHKIERGQLREPVGLKAQAIQGREVATAEGVLSGKSWRRLSNDCGMMRRPDGRDLIGKLGQKWGLLARSLFVTT